MENDQTQHADHPAAVEAAPGAASPHRTVDTCGRVIDYLRIAITDRCNYRCVYCMPADGVTDKCHRNIMTYEEIERFVRIAAEYGIKHIRLTGGEPLARLGCAQLAGMLKAIPGIEDIAITTNGALLPRYAKQLVENGVSRVNISLDTLDPSVFASVTRVGRLEDVLAGIDCALEAGFETVKINTVAVRALHQDFFSLAALSLDRPLHVRFIEYMPIGDDETRAKGIPEEENPHFKDPSSWDASDTIPSEELRRHISEEGERRGYGPLVRAEKARPDGHGPADYWRFEGAKGTVGFISAMSDHFCATCNRLRLTSDGNLRPCLFSDVEFPVREALAAGDDDAVRAVYETAVLRKPKKHETNDGTERFMSQIGG